MNAQSTEFPLELLGDPVAVKKHLDALEAQNKVNWGSELADLVRDTEMMVRESKDPDLMIKFAKFLVDYVGWGSAAKRQVDAQNSKPVFHITINKNTHALKVQTLDPDTNDVTDVFTMDGVSPTAAMVSALDINNDILTMDA